MTTVTNGTTEPHSLGDLPGQLDARRGGVGGEHPVAALGNVHRGAAGGPRSPQHPTGDMTVQHGQRGEGSLPEAVSTCLPLDPGL